MRKICRFVQAKLVSYDYLRCIYAFVFSYNGQRMQRKDKTAVQRDEKTCVKDVHPHPTYHHVYAIARFVDSPN
jgi:hypothetical protein